LSRRRRLATMAPAMEFAVRMENRLMFSADDSYE
jgi:hypothetical protein